MLILHCPFCGGRSAAGSVRYDAWTVREQGWPQDTFHYISCVACGANNKGIVGHTTLKTAAEQWNCRWAIRAAATAAPRPVSRVGAAPEVARPLAEWSEDHGDVVWWVFDADGNPTEAPWVGSPVCLGQTVELHAGQGPHKDPLLFRGHIGGWPGYHTHWTPLPATPALPIGEP